jgi:cytoskeletal protein RodZ
VTLGTSLRAARIAAKYSIPAVSEATRIRTAVIKDLENDSFDSCGGFAYARGHIRTIAKLVGADGDALILELETTTGETDRPMIDLLTENFATNTSSERSKISYKSMSIAAAVVVGALILTPAISSFTKSSTPTASALKANTNSAPVATPTPTPSDSLVAAVVATKSSDVSVVVTAATGSTWLGITDSSGAQVFSGKLSIGQTQTFADNQLLYFVIGNAGAVDLTVNGQHLGAPGAIGEVVHLQFGPGASSQG